MRAKRRFFEEHGKSRYIVFDGKDESYLIDLDVIWHGYLFPPLFWLLPMKATKLAKKIPNYHFQDDDLIKKMKKKAEQEVEKEVALPKNIIMIAFSTLVLIPILNRFITSLLLARLITYALITLAAWARIRLSHENMKKFIFNIPIEALANCKIKVNFLHKRSWIQCLRITILYLLSGFLITGIIAMLLFIETGVIWAIVGAIFLLVLIICFLSVANLFIAAAAEDVTVSILEEVQSKS